MSEGSAKPHRRKRLRKVSLEAVRHSLSDRLPFFIQYVAQEYESFAHQALPEDAKGVAAHHAACKAALSHLELLAKLTRWAQEEDDLAPVQEASQGEDLNALVQAAQQALQYN